MLVIPSDSRLMPASFYENPILNSPYHVPTRHHALDKDGQPLDQGPFVGRRKSELITPVPKAKKKSKAAAQTSFVMPDAQGLSTTKQEYNINFLVNEIRGHVEACGT